ncbi:hypothetical protein V8C26DRAFT_389783 [Trichoderma gracile]
MDICSCGPHMQASQSRWLLIVVSFPLAGPCPGAEWYTPEPFKGQILRESSSAHFGNGLYGFDLLRLSGLGCLGIDVASDQVVVCCASIRIRPSHRVSAMGTWLIRPDIAVGCPPRQKGFCCLPVDCRFAQIVGGSNRWVYTTFCA